MTKFTYPRKIWLGDFLGSLTYAGGCSECKTQFMTRNMYVWQRKFCGDTICEVCFAAPDSE